MSNTNNGGPAFPLVPVEYRGELVYGELGLTVRDYFAAKAMPAIYDVAMREAEQGSGLLEDDQWRVGLAFDAYKMADAMLRAREAE